MVFPALTKFLSSVAGSAWRPHHQRHAKCVSKRIRLRSDTARAQRRLDAKSIGFNMGKDKTNKTRRPYPPASSGPPLAVGWRMPQTTRPNLHQAGYWPKCKKKRFRHVNTEEKELTLCLHQVIATNKEPRPQTQSVPVCSKNTPKGGGMVSKTLPRRQHSKTQFTKQVNKKKKTQTTFSLYQCGKYQAQFKNKMKQE